VSALPPENILDVESNGSVREEFWVFCVEGVEGRIHDTFPLTSEIGMNEFHPVAGCHLYRGIVLGEDKTAVVLDDQVPVHFLKEINEIGQRRRRRHVFG
jgi:hypothetical protein